MLNEEWSFAHRRVYLALMYARTVYLMLCDYFANAERVSCNSIGLSDIMFHRPLSSRLLDWLPFSWYLRWARKSPGELSKRLSLVIEPSWVAEEWSNRPEVLLGGFKRRYVLWNSLEGERQRERERGGEGKIKCEAEKAAMRFPRMESVLRNCGIYASGGLRTFLLSLALLDDTVQ
jgi:hypothetical protein